jgi:hypothetical protein
MMRVMQLNNGSLQQSVTWEKLTESLEYLAPKSMHAKYDLFLRVIQSTDLTNEQFINAKLYREDIIQLCQTGLYVLGVKDEFFENLSLNFAKIMY